MTVLTGNSTGRHGMKPAAVMAESMNQKALTARTWHALNLFP